jgi:cyanophycin synthetase
VLLDYAHNAHSMEAVARTVRELAVHGRRIGVIAAPGDRRDEDIRALAAAAAPAFDLVMLREDDDLRGRQPGEVGGGPAPGPPRRRPPPERIVDGVFGEEAAVQKVLDLARAGDLLVIFGDKLQRDCEQIVNYKREDSGTPVEESRRQPELVESRMAS